MAATQPIRSKQQVREFAGYYLHMGQIRNYVLIILGIHTALRISDLLRLRWEDVYDFDNVRIRTSITITEKKTGKSKTVALNKSIVNAINLLVSGNAGKGRYIIENYRTGKAISRIQAYRIIRTASEMLRFQYRVSCHSLRKTFGYHAWKKGASPVVIMEIFNHSSLEVTRRYLGVTQDDKNEVYLELDFA